MASVLDEKRRVVLPKELAEELGLAEGTQVVFKRSEDGIVIQKLEVGGGKAEADALRRAMEWNPRRRGTPTKVREDEVKAIWR
ncbi:MAG: AbrB/MazE/SpoVT family DNA-binding domain-containing protein [Nitrososphaerales archaeon]|jgi:AbrB family looped-hinge helix DNA binding protein